MVTNNTPNYYRANGIDPFEILPHLYKSNNIQDPYLAFLYGNVVKYIWRCGAKGQFIQDLDKAIVYINEMKRVVEDD